MKKIILIIFIFVFLCCFEKDKIIADEINYSDDYVKTYYDTLYSNYLPNYSNTLCGYQAFCSLLSYWDNYWDDSFIQANYEQKTLVDGLGFSYAFSLYSPGIREVDLPIIEPQPHNIIYDFSGLGNLDGLSNEQQIALLAAQTHYNNYYSLFGKLLRLVNDSVYYFNAGILNTLYLNGMTANQTFDIYDSYFNDINSNTSFNSSNYNFIRQIGYSYNGNYMTITDLRNSVISYLEDGYPVICLLAPLGSGTYDFSFDGHYAVCYEYDSINNKIYGHTSVANGTFDNVYTRYDIDSYADDVSIAGYYVITPKNVNSHVCTWAYQNVNDFNEVKYYCPCFIYNHTHTLSQTQTEHSCTNLECGFHEEHYGSYTQKNQYAHFTYCIICNYTYIMSHDFEVHSGYSICRKCDFYQKGSDIIIYKKDEEELI